MSEIDVKNMTKDQLINIVKEQGDQLKKLEQQVQSNSDFLEGVRSAKAKKNDDGDWF